MDNTQQLNTLVGEIDNQLNHLVIEYIRFLTWEKVYKCGMTFHQILEAYYDGNLDQAYWDFLYRMISFIQTHTINQVLEWIIVTKQIRLSEEQIKRIIFLFGMFINTKSFDEIKELLDLEFSLK